MSSLKLKNDMEIGVFALNGRAAPWAIGAFKDAV
jgi:hypothetical protein